MIRRTVPLAALFLISFWWAAFAEEPEAAIENAAVISGGTLLQCNTATMAAGGEYDAEPSTVTAPEQVSEEPKPREVQRSCQGKVSIVKYSNGQWRMFVDGLPFFIKGVEYSPDRVGTRPKIANDWMKNDANFNGRIDGPFDSFIDANRNNVQDEDEETVGDFKLLNDMGCNVIRIYHPVNINKKMLRELHRNYGIYVIMGNFIGAYTVDSGAEWKAGTDYTDKKQRKKLLAELRKMIVEFKDEPFVLMWMLGNENDLVGSYANSTFNNTNAAGKPEAYASFVGEAAKMIKAIDKDHPVAVCNGSTKLLPYFNKYAKDVDIIGINSYDGPFGFGTMWNRAKESFDRPVMITEYGCDSYNLCKEQEDEDFQALYHKRAWLDIEKNSFGGKGAGNSIGGVIFCFVDKWWLAGKADYHDTDIGAWEGRTNDGSFQDEWMGLFGQGDGTGSPFVRQPKKAYYLYKNELWSGKKKN